MEEKKCKRKEKREQRVDSQRVISAAIGQNITKWPFSSDPSNANVFIFS